ncbi:MAG: histidinol-phosphate transaminase [Alphaproteobacteria bacterium]
MTDWPLNIARPAIAEFAAYSARGGATNALHLDANESPWSPPPSDGSVEDFNRYPEQQPDTLRTRLASLYGVPANSIMMGRGADESIEVIVRTFCEAGEDSILICPPTFGYFETAAKIQGAKISRAALLSDFTWDEALIRKMITKDTPKIVFLCSPNNPTGNSLDKDVIEGLCRDFKETLIVVDEAYIEFSPQDSTLALRNTYRNLVITRTLSKAYGLAGVRMGVCIADPSVIELMLKVLPPYPVPRPVEKAVLRALAPATMPVHAGRMQTWLSERERLMQELPRSQFVEKAYVSDANFILFTTANETGLLTALSKADVKIRDFRSKIAGHFRISIGTPEENSIALAALGITPEAGEKLDDRVGETFRKTNETDIAVRVNLDDPKTVKIDTGLGFFDHMLEQIAKHGGIGLTLTCKGDLEIDCHHTVEDTALAFGEALKMALGNKAGIGRYGFVMPMDETQARVAIDLSGRAAFVFKGEFPTDHVGEFSAEMCPHFFQSLSQSLGASIQIDVEGDNTHHIIEACFKGVGRALRPAFTRVGGDIPSTKGLL